MLLRASTAASACCALVLLVLRSCAGRMSRAASLLDVGSTHALRQVWPGLRLASQASSSIAGRAAIATRRWLEHTPTS
jgi:hypothetical protein